MNDVTIPALGTPASPPPAGRGGTAAGSCDNRALLARPSFSVRTRLVLAFGMIFALCMVITLWSIWSLSEIEAKLHFLEAADTYMVEIQQARRFEKNFLLYGTNGSDALEHAEEAARLLGANAATMEKTLGSDAFRVMVGHLSDYEQLLESLVHSGEERRPAVEASLRDHGGEMVAFAQDLVHKERSSVDRMLASAQRMPLYFLVVVLVLMTVIAVFISRQLLEVLSRFMQYTKRIGEGDFSPITPKRKYKDEFSQLAIALNCMIAELDHRERILVESHKLRAIGTLVAGVAHELNNPLNNTMLTAAGLEEDFGELDDDDKLEMVRDIIGETERARKIVRNLLDFARESEVELQPLELERIVRNAIELIANQVKLARVRLKTELKPDLPPVHGDEQMLHQVVINLILNAIDVLPQKGTITVSTYRPEEEGFVVLQVRDDGPGIPEHVLPRIFEPFFTTKAKGGGTGLGLSVSRGIVRRLGGYVKVDSAVGRGTTFTVYLPTTEVPSQISRKQSCPSLPRA